MSKQSHGSICAGMKYGVTELAFFHHSAASFFFSSAIFGFSFLDLEESHSYNAFAHLLHETTEFLAEQRKQKLSEVEAGVDKAETLVFV